MALLPQLVLFVVMLSSGVVEEAGVIRARSSCGAMAVVSCGVQLKRTALFGVLLQFGVS